MPRNNAIIRRLASPQKRGITIVIRTIANFGLGVLLWLICATCRSDAVNPSMTPLPPELPGIVGHDDRVPLYSTAWPWQAIGRFNQFGGYGHCTGTLISADTVLTAAHCVYDRQANRWLQPEEVVFVAGSRNDDFAGFAHGKAILRSPHVDPRTPSLDTVTIDWAIVKLEHALPVRPISVRSLPEMNASDLATLHFETAGYAHDRPDLLSLDDGCAVRSLIANGQVLVTDCDITNGDSGAPLLLRQGKDFRLVGVFSAAIATGTKTPESFAVSAAAFLNQLPK